jgi:hypothetical protein
VPRLKKEYSCSSTPPSGPSWPVLGRTLPLPYQILRYQIRKYKANGAYSLYVGGENRVQDFDGETRRKEAILRPRHGWVDSIKMDLQEIGCGRGLD